MADPARAAALAATGHFRPGGNVFEWNHTVETGAERRIRGGGFGYFDASFLAAPVKGGVSADGQTDDLGFRLAAAAPPLPAFGAVGIAVLAGLVRLLRAPAASGLARHRASSGAKRR
jgi:hypothetical protein